jgi:transposase-like protein
MPKTATGRPRKIAKATAPKVDAQPAAPLPQPVRVNNGSTGLNLPEEKQEAIARMHAAGVPVTRIASEVGVSYHSVAGLIRNRPDLLDAARDITSKNWRTLAALGTAQLVDRLPEMKDQALSVLAAIATEKAELLSGGATSRVEIVSAPSADEWLDVVDGVVIESGPLPTGITGQTRPPKAHKRTQQAALPAPDGEQPSVSCSVSSVDAAGVPTFEPDEARFLPPPPPSDGGGAGVRPSSRSSYPDSTDDEKFFTKR